MLAYRPTYYEIDSPAEMEDARMMASRPCPKCSEPPRTLEPTCAEEWPATPGAILNFERAEPELTRAERNALGDEACKAMRKGRKKIPLDLPVVAGRMDCSIRDHEQACLVLLDQEQRKISPDNRIIATLCDSVKMGREWAERVRQRPDPRLAELLAAARDAAQLLVAIAAKSDPNPGFLDQADDLAERLRAAIAAIDQEELR